MPSKCIMFADDVNIHTTSKENAQILLNICYSWSQEYGMSFAPEKCFIVANIDMLLHLGEDTLPQVEETKYLGIKFNHKGPNWKQLAVDLNTKAKSTIIALMNIGFNKNGWAPAAKITVYKLFIRSILEYGMQIHLYEGKVLNEFEKTQFLALRILYGVSWNTSKNGLKRLSCIESMQCRNEILNAKFIRNLKDKKIPACRLMNMNLSNKKSIYARNFLENYINLAIKSIMQLKN